MEPASPNAPGSEPELPLRSEATGEPEPPAPPAEVDPLDELIDEQDAPIFDEVPPDPIVAVAPGASTSRSAAAHLPGPGLPESIGWFFGVYAVQMMASAGILLVLGVYFAIRQNLTDLDDIRRMLKDLTTPGESGSVGTLIIGVTQLAFVLAAIVGALVRLRPGSLRRLSFSAPPWRHALLILVVMLPLSLVSGQAYTAANEFWNWLTRDIEFLQQLKNVNIMESMKAMMQGVPLPLGLLMFAVAPAVAEELVFRGVIGRGLVARWGLIVGVLITSFFFAAAHMHPAHVLGVMPLGIFIHLAYLSTRSFWAPMAMHFLNNALATVVMSMQTEEMPPALADDGPISPRLVVTALLTVVSIGVLLWRSRVVYVDGNGVEWSPGYPTAETPPPELHLQRRCRPAGALAYVVAFASAGAFLAALGAAGAAEAEKRGEQPPAEARAAIGGTVAQAAPR